MWIPLSLLFVGWWTTGPRGMVTGGQYEKPSLSVSPEVVTLGGNVTVRCSDARHPGAKFSLRKSNSYAAYLTPSTTKDYEAEFIFSNTQISDAGVYRCWYGFLGRNEFYSSDDSDAAHINVTDPGMPKPSIKVNPRGLYDVRSNITIVCEGQETGLSFFLRKVNTREILQVEAGATAKATFRFSLVKMEDAGRYICQYHHKSRPFVWSVQSDPVELVLKDPSFSKPSITVRPKARNHKGETVTIECEGSEDTVNFSLLKSKRLTVLQEMKEKYKRANFSLPALRAEDAGRYACQYCLTKNPFVCSEPSDPVRVTVIDNSMTTIIWASGALGLLLVLFLLMLVLLLCKKRKKRSTVNEGNQPMNRLLEQNAGTDHGDREDQDGVTYAVLSPHSVKIKQPPSQPTGLESCIYASVAK